LDSIELSSSLKRERLSSMKLLDDTALHLRDLALQMAEIKKDDEGNIIQRAQAHNVQTAVMCLTELRNVMKTKLEFLRLGKELMEMEKSK
jgi:hypothetical protein